MRLCSRYRCFVFLPPNINVFGAAHLSPVVIPESIFNKFAKNLSTGTIFTTLWANPSSYALSCGWLNDFTKLFNDKYTLPLSHLLLHDHYPVIDTRSTSRLFVLWKRNKRDNSFQYMKQIYISLAYQGTMQLIWYYIGPWSQYFLNMLKYEQS